MTGPLRTGNRDRPTLGTGDPDGPTVEAGNCYRPTCGARNRDGPSRGSWAHRLGLGPIAWVLAGPIACVLSSLLGSWAHCLGPGPMAQVQGPLLGSWAHCLSLPFLQGGGPPPKLCTSFEVYMIKWPGRLPGYTPGGSSGLSGGPLGSLVFDGGMSVCLSRRDGGWWTDGQRTAGERTEYRTSMEAWCFSLPPAAMVPAN